MVDVTRFTRELPLLWEDFPQSPHPKDRSLSTVLESVQGMATENKLKLLNFACSLLGPDDVYLEVGTWQGATLVGALLGNACRAVAVDNFSQFKGTRETLDANIARFGVGSKLEIVESDSFAFARNASLARKSVGVYFYDGDHSYNAQFKALQLFEPFLQDEAIVLVDDTTMGQVFRANKDFAILNAAHWKLTLDIRSPYPKEPLWWNGVQIFHFKRSGREGKAVHDARQLANTLLCTCGTVYNDKWMPTYARAKNALRNRFGTSTTP